MTKKIVVPEGMLVAGVDSVARLRGMGETTREHYTAVLKAALLWLSENPIVPTERQERDLCDAWMEAKQSQSNTFVHASAFGAVEWQRRMFLAPEPEVPEEIEDLIPCGGIDTINADRILEAYRRGLARSKENG